VRHFQEIDGQENATPSDRIPKDGVDIFPGSHVFPIERPAIWHAFIHSTRDLLLGARHAKAFPVEQKGRYSLAHIHRVVQALGDVDLDTVVQNVVELLSTCEMREHGLSGRYACLALGGDN
jgi:hypothetical protein